MTKFLHLAFLVLFFCIWQPVQAAPERRGIPAYIEANRRNHDIILNSAKYDPKAKVYYIYHTRSIYDKEDFDENTRFLAQAYKKIYRRGAELIICINYGDDDKETFKRNKKYGYVADIPQECRSFMLKCPIVNTFHGKTRSALFKPGSDGYTYSYSYPYLRAVNADGEPIGYFFLENDTIIMRDSARKKRKVVLQSGFPTAEWVAHAIIASHKELVDQVTQEEAPAEEAAAAPAASNDEEEEEKPRKKKKKKKSEPSRQNRWKKLDI